MGFERRFMLEIEIMDHVRDDELGVCQKFG